MFNMVVGWHPGQPSLIGDDNSDVEIIWWSVAKVSMTSRGPTEAYQALEKLDWVLIILSYNCMEAILWEQLKGSIRWKTCVWERLKFPIACSYCHLCDWWISKVLSTFLVPLSLFWCCGNVLDWNFSTCGRKHLWGL